MNKKIITLIIAVALFYTMIGCDITSVRIEAEKCPLSKSGAVQTDVYKNIENLGKDPQTVGILLQEMVQSRAEGLLEWNRPYTFDGVRDCYGYVRQIWNSILSAGNAHVSDFFNYSYEIARLRINVPGGLPVDDYQSSDWEKITDLDELKTGDILGTTQGHSWGDAVHYGIFAGKSDDGSYMQWDCGTRAPARGAYKRTISPNFKYFYRPVHDLLKFQPNARAQSNTVVYNSEQCKIRSGNLIKGQNIKITNIVNVSAINATIIEYMDGHTLKKGWLKTTEWAVLGDANNDGNINSTDYTLIKRYILEKPVNNFKYNAADISGDGKVDSRDLVLLKRYNLEMIKCLLAKK